VGACNATAYTIKEAAYNSDITLHLTYIKRNDQQQLISHQYEQWNDCSIRYTRKHRMT